MMWEEYHVILYLTQKYQVRTNFWNTGYLSSDAGKAKIMFRYATGHGCGNCDLLSLGIIMRPRYGNYYRAWLQACFT